MEKHVRQNWIYIKKIEGKYECPYCKKLYSNLGISGHVWAKHIEGGGKRNRTLPVWNKGLTKETDERVKRNSENVSKAKKGKPGRKQSEAEKIKKSNTIKKKVKEGTWHYSFSKVRTYEYKGVKLHGKWELQYAQWLDKNNVKWRRPKEKFVYIFEEKERFYTPDFYLIDSNEYIEIKGYETEKDRVKWNQFPLKLRTIKGKELFELNIITKDQLKGLK